MHEFELTLKLRNNLIKRRRLGLGLSPRAAAKAAGVTYSRWLQYEAMTMSPLAAQHGMTTDATELPWKPTAQKIADYFGEAPEVLWPDAVLAVKQPTVVAEITAERALLLARMGASLELPPTPEELVGAEELQSMCMEALDTLPAREREVVVRTIMEGDTLRTVAIGINRTGQTVRMMRDKAIARLQKELRGGGGARNKRTMKLVGHKETDEVKP